MDRRRFFSALGISALIPVFGDGEKDKHPPTEWTNRDIWITQACSHRVDDRGEWTMERGRPLYVFGASQEEIEADYRKAAAKREDSTTVCGARYRRVLGSIVNCPKCGGPSLFRNKDRDIGILVD